MCGVGKALEETRSDQPEERARLKDRMTKLLQREADSGDLMTEAAW